MINKKKEKIVQRQESWFCILTKSGNKLLYKQSIEEYVFDSILNHGSSVAEKVTKYFLAKGTDEAMSIAEKCFNENRELIKFNKLTF